MSNTYQSKRGFTIVELLIVIVVIAILAAISIVAYTGIQNNARKAERQADATNIAKVIEGLNGDGNGYPTTAATINAGSTNIKLPQGVQVATNPISSAPATNAAAAYTGGTGGTAKQYPWMLCTTSGNTTGIAIYYYDPTRAGTDTTPGRVVAGSGC